jgi:oligoribonuclease NrnB/cAMP/cGMP phosphodiesterase (DHH superfamily)
MKFLRRIESIKIFFHNDNDGRCAGNIIVDYYGHTMEENRDDYIEINYDKEFPMDIIQQDETVYIVDYSIPPELMWELQKRANVVWIDHHATAIEKYKDYLNPIQGIRKTCASGCELTWMYFYGNKSMPDAVMFIGD